MSSVFWARLGPVGALLARSIPMSSPPLLIVSLPRSGSSWVGKTIGRAADALYLREPISQSHLRRQQRRGVVFTVAPGSMPDGYEAAAETAFAGIPAFPPNVVTFPDQWRLSRRRGKRLVVKEVNPLALDWLAREYRPRVIYLVRHPAGVAASFARLGWLAEERDAEAEQRFSARRAGIAGADLDRFADSPWAEHGALQAAVMKHTLQMLAAYPDHLVVRYEELCAEPLQLFRRLFDFAGLEWHAGVEQAILSETQLEQHNRFETYSTHRSSRLLIDSWKDDVPAPALAELRRGFIAGDPPFYAEGW